MMIDLHCHILPGLDDGPKDLKDTLAMARIAAADGVHTICASPHLFNGVFATSRTSILERLAQAREAVQAAGIGVVLRPAADMHLTPEFFEALKNRSIITIGETGKYMLLEFPSTIPSGTPELIFQLRLQGYVPILTHPERATELAENPKKLKELVRLGCLTQITAASLTGQFGRAAQKAADRFVRDRIAHLIATDAHDPEFRPPILSQAFNVLRSLVGTAEAEEIMLRRPQLVLQGKTFAVPEPRKRFFE